MSAFVLKIIACITMFIDHLSYIIPGDTSFLNCIGRIAFPIFAFQISEGYIHTKNIKKYLSRLFIFALISQIPFMLFQTIYTTNLGLNVLFTLVLGLLSIIIYDKYNKYIGIIVAFYFALIAQLTKCDYGFYGVAVVFLFFVFKEEKIFAALSFLLAVLCYYSFVILSFAPYGISALNKAFILLLPNCIFAMATVIPIHFYNQKKGLNTKHLLYLFYPLHLLLLYIIYLIY